MENHQNSALQIKGLTKIYDNNFKALKGIDLEVEQGDFFALLGPNGAGKSTTIGVICSLVRKSSGNVKIFGIDIDDDFSAAKQYVGVVPQEFNFNQFEKPIDILVTQAGYYGIPAPIATERAHKYLKLLGLWEKHNVPSRSLSGGMKRRLMIARALIHKPKLLVLDEPTAGVDIELRRSMWSFLEDINRQGTTIILTTHYLEEAERLCRSVAIIDKGKIVKNTSVKNLIKQLNKETFVLDLKGEIKSIKALDGYPFSMIDNSTLEVCIGKDMSLNQLFKHLSAEGVEILSMRNKANRLEELFIDMVEKNLTANEVSNNE